MINKRHNTGSSKSKGFTLVELMIVVAIIAILATIAFPSYTQYVVRVHRLEAMDEMQSMLSAEEKYFVENLKYTDLVADIGFAGRTLEKYTISMAFCNDPDDGCVKISAQPIGSQVSDGLLTITTEGAKTGPWN